MDTQTQIDRLIELAIIQRSELKQLVEQLPQLREHLNAEVEKVFDETEPQLRAELEEWTTKQTADKTAALGVALEVKIADLAKSLEVSTQARYNAIIAERAENARLAAQAEAKIAEHAASLPSAVKDIVTAELARFPRAGEIDQLRKEFAEPKSLNPRGKWQAGETYNKLDLVTINGDSYTSNTDGNRTRPSRSSADWTLVAARGTGGGGGPTSLSELTTVPSDGDLLIGSGTSWVTSNLTAGAGISITVGPGAITISATDGDITLDDGTAASPSLHFTNDPDTGIYRPAANTLGISTSGVQRMYVDQNGITTVGAGGTFDGSVHAANGNANNPSFSFSGDQDTGFFRHQPNEIGIALGGTQYATLTSTTFSITPVVTMASSLRVNGTTDSSSKDTGAIVTEGGLGVEKSASIGGNLTVSGTGTSSVAGSLGIATISPNKSSFSTAVTVNGATNSGFEVAVGDTRIAGFYAASSAAVLNAFANVPLYFSTNNTTKMTLTESGSLLIGTTTDRGRLTINKTASDTLSTANAAAFIGQPDNLEAGLLMQQTATTPYSFVLQGRSPSGVYQFPISLNPQGGNVLIGTTVDSSALLQVGTNTTTAAGGMKFGTDVSLYRQDANTLVVQPTGSSKKVLFYGDSNVSGLFNSLSSYEAIYFDPSAHSIKLATNGFTAVTLDTSQNATFAGQITASGISHKLGSGGTGAANALLTLDGSSASSYGSYIVLQRNSTNKWQFGTYSGINGGTSDDFLLYNPTAANEALKIAAATSNATFAGNLTVSGGQALISHSGTYANIYFSVGASTYSEIRAFSSTGEFRTNSGPSAGWGGFLTWQTDASEKMRLTNGGNLLLKSDGIDSANGKLQLATHTTSAGGIGFGTDTSLFRSSANTLRVGAGGSFLLLAPDGTTYNLQVYRSAADAILRLTKEGVADWDFFAGTDLVIKRNNTTALTLDSSQNATFAGNVLVNSTYSLGAAATGNQPYVQSEKTGKTLDLRGGVNGSRVLNNTGTAAVFNLTDGGNATFAGSIAIGNTVNTVSPTSPNRTITMVIGGTTYYIHAKTTND